MSQSIKFDNDIYIDTSGVRKGSAEFSKLIPFGDDSRFLGNTNYTDINDIISRLGATEGVGIFTCENHENMTINGVGCGNRQYIIGWFNSSLTYGHCLVMSFASLMYGRREGSSTTTWTRLV